MVSKYLSCLIIHGRTYWAVWYGPKLPISGSFYTKNVDVIMVVNLGPHPHLMNSDGNAIVMMFGVTLALDLRLLWGLRSPVEKSPGVGRRPSDPRNSHISSSSPFGTISLYQQRTRPTCGRVVGNSRYFVCGSYCVFTHGFFLHRILFMWSSCPI